MVVRKLLSQKLGQLEGVNMNFQDLLAKIKSIDESVQADVQAVGAAPSQPEFPSDGHAQLENGNDMPKAGKPGLAGDDEILIGEKNVEECGDMGPSAAPRQADNVTMNVSMNGSGAGGIADLMKILRNIESGGGDKDVVVGMDEVSDGDFQSATTEPDEEYGSIDCVTKTGNDLHSQGAEKLKVNGGGNPMQESLVQRLTAHYESIKNR